MIRQIHTIGGIIMMAWIWISKMNVSGIFKNTDLPYTKNILYLSSSGWHSILGEDVI